MTTEKLPPKILIREGPVWREALFVGVSQGLPAYEIDHFAKDVPDRLTTDTHRALDLIGKTLEP